MNIFFKKRDLKKLKETLKKNEEYNAIEVLEKWQKNKKFGFVKSIIPNTENITIICPPISERWLVQIRNIKQNTMRIYNSDGLIEN